MVIAQCVAKGVGDSGANVTRAQESAQIFDLQRGNARLRLVAIGTGTREKTTIEEGHVAPNAAVVI